MEKGRGLFVKLEFPWSNRIIFVLNNQWTWSMARGPCPAVVHGGPTVDGGTELFRAWPPAAPVLKGVGQGAEDGETGRGTRYGPHRRAADGEVAGRRREQWWWSVCR
jgi:hypothetical protein